MRLKKLILQGFKSFADRTELGFDCPITGIVGPNGCGKSNVVDAFKWVLGEQSAKSLRGDAMMDVIFNGSSARKPAGMAEVILVFDNPKRPDGARVLNLDSDDVQVGRRLFRDGTSEYQLNNQATRLKDVRELFFDTGIGVDAYSVIEQGRVSAMLESNPQERRLIFEEAAGISKFKAKKKEAQRKLERVDQNLLRVNDIVEEVEKRLRSVKVQAGRARTFQEHSQRLRELRLTYALQEYSTLHIQLEQHASEQGKAQADLERLDAELSEKQMGLSATKQQFDGLSQQKQRAEYEQVQAAAGLQSSRQRQEYAQQQIQQIDEQIQAFEQDRQSLQEKAAQTEQALASEQKTLEQLSAQLREERGRIEQEQQNFHNTQLELNQIHREAEQNKAAILDLMRRAAGVNNRLGAIEIERKNIAAQQQRLGQRRQIVVGEMEGLEAARAEQSAALDAVLAEIGQIQSQLEQSTAQAATLGRQIAQTADQLGAAREHRSGLISRQKLLEDLEARREGFTEGVKSVLRERNDKYPFIRGVVADFLRVDVEHAMVIEAALDGRDQMLIADSSAAVEGTAEALAELEGRVNILCTDQLAAEAACAPVIGYDWNVHPQRIRLAVDLVKFEPADAPVAHHLLGTTIVVDDLAEAESLRAAAPTGYRYVTPNGEVLEADGTLRTGPLTAAMGLISRRSELEALKLQIADVDKRIAELASELSEGTAQAKALQEKQQELRSAVYASNTRKVETTSRISQIADKQNAFRRELPVLERELQNFMDQGGRLKTEEAGLTEKRQAIEAEQTARQQQIERLDGRQGEAEVSLKQIGEALTLLRVELGQVQEKQLSSQQAVQRLTATRGELEEQLDRVKRSAEQATARHAAVEKELAAAKAAEEHLAEKHEKLARQIESLETDVNELGQRVAQLQEEVQTLSQEHAAVAELLHQLQIKLGEARVRLEGVVQRTLDELQLDLPARWAELEQQGGYQPAETNWDAVADEIRQLKEKIQRLGNVNLDAIGELDELEKRQTFLSGQVTDLTQSKQQLEELIDTINKESSVRFEQTFNAVREHFQTMFRKLFGGGKADIFLETSVDEPADQQPVIGPDGQAVLPVVRKTIDPLEAGIEINRAAAGQAAGVDQPAIRRREDDDVRGAADEHFQEQAQPVLHPGRGGRGAGRGEQPAVQPDRAGVPGAEPVHHHHALEADDADRGHAVWRDDAGAGRVEASGGAVRSGGQPGPDRGPRGGGGRSGDGGGVEWSVVSWPWSVVGSVVRLSFVGGGTRAGDRCEVW